MKPEDLKQAFSKQQIPEHRAGFWDDISAELDDVTRRKRRHPVWLIPFEAAAAVLALIGIGVILGGTPSDLPLLSPLFDEDVVAIEEPNVPPTTEPVGVAAEPALPNDDGPGPGTLPVTDDSGAAEPEPVPAGGNPADPQDGPLPAPPWSAPSLELIAVKPAIVDAWLSAENQLWCTALYPAGFETGDAEIRQAEFAGGWAVAWDLPELRSAFGIAGVGLSPADDTGIRMVNQVHYEGVVIGYDGEGFDPSNPRRLAEFAIPGQGCMYQVWSELGDDHLVALVDSLRFVTGLVAEPLPREVVVAPIDLGPAPWDLEPVTGPEDDPEPPDGVPRIATTAGIPDEATKRVAVVLDWAVAWDLPSGPGHDELDFACGDCGRGVFGVGVSVGAVEFDHPDYRWDDDSTATVLPRVGDPAIPIDRIRVRAGDTGELVPEGVRVDISMPAQGITITVWSHLGLESALEIVEGLRFAVREQASEANAGTGDTIP